MNMAAITGSRYSAIISLMPAAVAARAGDALALLAPGDGGEGIVADDLRRRGADQRRRFQHLLVVALAEQLDQARERARATASARR